MNVLASSARRQRHGFTLLEILLAVSLTAVIGLSVAIMLGAMNSATQVEGDARRGTIRRQVASARLGNTIRSAVMVLAAGDDHLVLWHTDANQNTSPDLSELVRVEFDSDAGELQSYAAPDDLDPMSDISYDLTDDFGAITAGLAGSAALPRTRLVSDVTACDIELDQADPQEARLIRVQMTIDQPSGPVTVTIAVGLRALPG